MRKFVYLSLVCLMSVTACGKGGGGAASSPADLGKAFVEAANKADEAGIKALFPSDEVLKSAMECSDTKIFERVAKSREGLAKDLLSEPELKGATLAFVSAEDRKSQKFAKGEEKEGCKYKTDVEILKQKWKFTITKDGKTEEEGEGVRVGKIDGKWYLISF